MKLRFTLVFLKWFSIYGSLFGAFGAAIYLMLLSDGSATEYESQILPVSVMFLIPVLFLSLNNAYADMRRKKHGMKPWEFTDQPKVKLNLKEKFKQ
tara:strand:+ start:1236 stop:1523 length:288 start_codon:yes stop_codon:yes gene_type:complete